MTICGLGHGLFYNPASLSAIWSPQGVVESLDKQTDEFIYFKELEIIQGLTWYLSCGRIRDHDSSTPVPALISKLNLEK